MTVPVIFWLFLGGWAIAAVLGLIKLAFAALAADARGTRLPARSLLPALRNAILFGVMATSIVMFSAMFHVINKTWHLSLTLFSYDLAPYNGSVKRAVVVGGVWICSGIVFMLADALLDRLLPTEPENPDADDSNDRRVANGHHA